MGKPDDIPERVAALEERVDRLTEDVPRAVQDARAARHLAAAVDRDISDLAKKVDSNTRAINALGVQTRERFDVIDRRMDTMDGRMGTMDGRMDTMERRMDRGFAEMQGKFDALTAGQEQIVGLLTTVINQQGGDEDDRR